MSGCSVIIPVFNADPYLRKCLDSVLEQTLRDIEVICIDDGSTDHSGAILAEYASKDARVRVLSQKNAGQGAARNRGLEASSGEFVYFMDADDELASADALERLVSEARRLELDAFFFDAETRVDEGLSVPETIVNAQAYIRRRDYTAVRSGRELFAMFIRNREYTVSPCLVLLRKRFLDSSNVKFPEERIFYEDNIFMTRVMLSAERASHRPWRLYVRKVHAGSTVTSKPGIRHLRGYLACYLDAVRLVAADAWDVRTRTALKDRVRIYKLNVRRIAEASPELVKTAELEMSDEERGVLESVQVYPLGEKIVNSFHCLRERGLAFTLKRILFGRQP